MTVFTIIIILIVQLGLHVSTTTAFVKVADAYTSSDYSRIKYYLITAIFAIIQAGIYLLAQGMFSLVI